MATGCRRVSCLLVTVLILAGCSSRPTYPKARLEASIQQVLKSEGLDASVRVVDHTLGIQLDYPGALVMQDNRVSLGPDFNEAARKIITSLHRVLLSTDAQVDFYVILLSDPQAPGAYLTIVRYMDDVRRANANMLDTFEMFARTILELNFAGGQPVTLEQYVPRDIHLEEFLSWQLARRIQAALSEELQTAGVAAVGRCGGRFQDREFAFTLDVTPTHGGALDETTLQEVFHTSTNVIAKVLSSYNFESYDKVRLIHPMTGRNLVLPKTHLDIFRNQLR